ncbi:hypothetical protein KR009_011916, partial [Drosophila setifemur]
KTFPAMSSGKKFLLLLFLSHVMAQKTNNHQLIYINNLLESLSKTRSIQTMILFQQNKNCFLEDMNPNGIPILRSTGNVTIKLKNNFNSISLAIVCICDEGDVGLLRALANAFENLLDARIILYVQREVTEQLLDKIAKEVIKHKLIHMIVLGISDHGSEPVSFHRWMACPTKHFDRITNMNSNSSDTFFNKCVNNFLGMTAIVKPFDNIQSTQKRATNIISPILRVEDIEIAEFARKYNISLTLFKENDSDSEYFDIQLGSQFITKKNSASFSGFVNPFGSTSLIVVVPCNNNLSLKDVFNHLDVETWFIHFMFTYILLVLAEFLIRVLRHRIYGTPCDFWRINPVVNLRAFRAILGMSFPINRRSSLSLRQLFLGMSVFGLVSSNFFSCKLSALLTKWPQQPHVTNFEELRASGLSVIVSQHTRQFIEDELGADFFQRVVPNIWQPPNVDQIKLVISYNNTYAFILSKKNWLYLNNFRLGNGLKAFCTSEDLAITDYQPRAHILQKDSIFKRILSMYVIFMQEAGMEKPWNNLALQTMKKNLNITQRIEPEPEAKPLTVDHLKWTGFLLILGYGLATVVFIGEVIFYHGKKRNQRTKNGAQV